MPDHKQTYQKETQQYDLMVKYEDMHENILPAIRAYFPKNRPDVVETGAGTGRITSLLLPVVNSIKAFDIAFPMITLAKTNLINLNKNNWHVGTADHRQLPVKSCSVDMVISGWSLCYLSTWGKSGWENEVNKALLEFKRILKPNGVIILLETLGTGVTQPAPPEKLLPYFDLLETNGFQKSWIRTDYHFPSVDEKNELIGSFFGDEMNKNTLPDNTCIVPECTGIWVLKSEQISL